MIDIVFNRLDLVNRHAALNTPVDRAFFVVAEVMPGVGAHQNQDFVDRAVQLLRDIAVERAGQHGVRKIGDDFFRQLVGRCHHVGHTGVQRTARHGVKGGRLRCLHKHAAGFFFQGPQAERAVRAHARQNDASGVGLLVQRQRTQKKINRQLQAAWRHRLEQMQNAVQQGELKTRRRHIHMVGLHRRAVAHLHHRQHAHALQQAGQQTFLDRVHVLHHHIRQSAARRHMREELLQRLQPARRRTDADDRRPGAHQRPIGRCLCRRSALRKRRRLGGQVNRGR